jgi:rRNA maturation endonuclease Nob1
MNITIDSQESGLANGYGYYCPGCDMFFSVSSDQALKMKYCPVCGWETLIRDQKTFEAEFPVKSGRLAV